MPHVDMQSRQSLQETIACCSDDDKIIESYLQLPTTPQCTSIQPQVSHPSAIDLTFRQLWMLPLLGLAFAGIRYFIYRRCLPLFAAFLMCVLSVEYFWICEKIMPSRVPPKPLCIQIAQLHTTRYIIPFSIAYTMVSACSVAGFFYGIAHTISVYYLSATEDIYMGEMETISLVTGLFGGTGAILCPSKRAAITLLLYCCAYVLQSVDIVAARAQVRRRTFIVDNGELVAQIGVVVMLVVLFQGDSPREVFTRIAQHVSGLIHIYGSCSTMSGYFSCLNRNQAVSIFEGVICIAWGANLTSYLWYRFVPEVGKPPHRFSLWNRRIMPCLGTASPTVYSILVGGVGGVGGMCIACLLHTIPGSFVIQGTYAFLAVLLAKICKGWWIMIRQRASNSPDSWSRYGTPSDAVLLLLPLVLCFYPYYRLRNPDDVLLPRLRLIALQIIKD